MDKMASVEQLQDALCMCREFSTPVTKWKNKINAQECLDLGFHDRWKKVSNIPALTFDANSQVVRPGGLHALIFAAVDDDDNDTTFTIAFRHQEGEMLWDNDQLESMGLWGRNFIQQQVFPKAAAPGTLLSRGAYSLQSMIHHTRRFLQLDYVTQSEAIVQAVMASSSARTTTTLRFTGYSLGGAIAQVAALSHQADAVLFASVGVQDVVQRLYPDIHRLLSTTPRIVNVFQQFDPVPALDCQFGLECIFASNGNPIHEDLVYGPDGLDFILQSQSESSMCLPSSAYNPTYAVCAATQPTHGEDGSVLQFQTTLLVIFITCVVYIIYQRRRTF